MTKLSPSVVTLFLLFLPLSLQAKILWQDFSVTYLNGQHYQVGDPKREVITLEHAASTSWGDSFMFFDHLRSENGERSNYTEWSPRVSLCKVEISCFSNAWIKELFIASTIEMSTVSTDVLLGMGSNWDISGFKFLQINVYRRQNDNVTNNWQVTTSWSRPFALANQKFTYDGFIDWNTTTVDRRSSMNWTSQLKWSATEWLGLSSTLYFGVEYVYWRNKFGIADSSNFRTNESNVNVLVKWHF
ncbi:DUF5020 family protein [Paraglaciecola hydrolytica]|uniref:Nucleoside-binding protein n=1 Tax=Paraglaciecola hydrolytica TaxID=1799789 RepID=A0A136A1I8_9ALTE|nr:DUF5020 family protein [Paraglaciecola hydrolytica]KXI29084.1 nucleoside-binding protein [Paraglaciecola hydrolytica]